MASTYTTTKTAAGVQARAGIGVHSIQATFEASAALIINDVIQMVKIPAGATILDVILSVDDLDSGTSIVLDVGDGTTTGRFISGSTVGQAGGTVRLSVTDGNGYTYAAADTIDIKVTTAPAGGGTGTLNLTVLYTMDK